MENEKDKELLSETLSQNFRPNSKVSREKAKTVEKKKIEQVTSGPVKHQKKSFGRKITDTFLEDNTKSVGNYVFYDVLIPAAKAMVSDMVSGGIEMLLFGGRKGSRTARDGNRSYVNYNSASYSRYDPRHGSTRGSEREMSRVGRTRHDFGEIILETRGEAEEVLSHLVDLTIDYQMASVADLYDLVGIASNFTDNKYGWTDLRHASVSRVHGGYLINLPRTQVIE